MKKRYIVGIIVFSMICIIGIVLWKQSESIPNTEIYFSQYAGDSNAYSIEIKDHNKISLYRISEVKETGGKRVKFELEKKLTRKEIFQVNHCLNNISGTLNVKGMAKKGWSYTLRSNNVVKAEGIYGLCTKQENLAIENLLNLVNISREVLPAPKNEEYLVKCSVDSGFEICFNTVNSNRIIRVNFKGNREMEIIEIEMKEENYISVETITAKEKIKISKEKWNKINKIVEKITRVDESVKAETKPDGSKSHFRINSEEIGCVIGVRLGFGVDKNYNLLIEEVQKIIEESKTIENI